MSGSGADILYERPVLERWARTVRAGIVAAGLGVGLLGASPAEAQVAVPFGEGGVFLGWTWGLGEHPGGFTWGFEGRGGIDLAGSGVCRRGDAEFTTAGIARLSFVELTPQLHIGAQAGVLLTQLVSGVGEIGIGYRFGDEGGWSLPIGFELRVFAASTYFFGDPLLETVSTGGGGFGPPRIPQSCAIIGRPLHDDRGHAPLPSLTRLEAEADAIDRGRGEAIATAYESRARTEWASVPAFVQLAAQLGEIGAPAALRRRALAAADDEVRHAIGTARAAMRWTGAPIALGRVTPATRAHARGDAALIRLAVESWIDGCLGEGRAAAIAARESQVATDAPLSELQRTIAADEARHAELAWDVLAWAIARGGDDVRHALDAVREAAPEEATAPEEHEDLAAVGLLPSRDARSIADAQRERAMERLDTILA